MLVMKPLDYLASGFLFILWKFTLSNQQFEILKSAYGYIHLHKNGCIHFVYIICTRMVLSFAQEWMYQFCLYLSGRFTSV